VLPASALALVRSHLRFLCTEPTVYARTLLSLVSSPHPSARARGKTVLHFGEGVHAAWLIRRLGATDHLHAHFVDRAALLALIVGRLLRVPFSATAHANDIYVNPVLLPEKIGHAKFIATCTRYNERHLESVAPAGARGRIRCIYHGLDAGGFPEGRTTRPRPLVLAVGQLKEKKGFGHLLEACRRLQERGVVFDCEIVGDGPLREELEAAVVRLGLTGRVRLRGALTNDAVLDRYAEAAVFALPCVTGVDGDRDGIPNVILEAMAMELPVVSTRHSGIPEAVGDEETGLLVPPGDVDALADALERLLADPTLRAVFGRAGRRRVLEVFDADVNVRKLLEEFAA